MLEEIVLAGQLVKAGELVKVTGLRGTFRFQRHVTTQKGEWLDCFEGGGRARVRSFHINRVQPIKKPRSKKGGT